MNLKYKNEFGIVSDSFLLLVIFSYQVILAASKLVYDSRI